VTGPQTLKTIFKKIGYLIRNQNEKGNE
jgi:hypothetical protein